MEMFIHNARQTLLHDARQGQIHVHVAGKLKCPCTLARIYVCFSKGKGKIIIIFYLYMYSSYGNFVCTSIKIDMHGAHRLHMSKNRIPVHDARKDKYPMHGAWQTHVHDAR